MAKKLLASLAVAVGLSDYRTQRYHYTGPSEVGNGNVFPVGLCRVACTDFIGVAYVDPVGREIVSMFSLEPGKIHVVKTPDNVDVVVECDPAAQYFVSYSTRFNKSDPTRIESTLIRPKTPQEEMQDYLNEVAARAASAEISRALREGRAEFDMTNDDYDEDKEDDEIAPLSVYQMEGILKVMQEDLAAKYAAQKDIEEEAPPVDLKKGGNEPPASPDPADPKK